MFKDSKTPYVFHHWGFLQLAVIFFLTFGVYLAQKKARSKYRPGQNRHFTRSQRYTLLDHHVFEVFTALDHTFFVTAIVKKSDVFRL